MTHSLESIPTTDLEAANGGCHCGPRWAQGWGPRAWGPPPPWYRSGWGPGGWTPPWSGAYHGAARRRWAYW